MAGNPLPQNESIQMTDSPKPTILVDVYGTKPVLAATFGQGARNTADIQQAADARRQLAENPASRRDSR